MGSAASASPTIWGNNAVFGNPILQEWDRCNGHLLETNLGPHGVNGRGVAQSSNVRYYTGTKSNSVYAYNFVTNTELGTAFTVTGATGGATTLAYNGSHFWIGGLFRRQQQRL